MSWKPSTVVVNCPRKLTLLCMDKRNEQSFTGFEATSIQNSVDLYLKCTGLVEIFEKALQSYVGVGDTENSDMDLSLTKCYWDATSSSTSYQGIVADHDSGYISQNVESNSSVELTCENRSTGVVGMMSGVKGVYVDEDTLLEQPQISSSSEVKEGPDEFEEFGHLFYMTDGAELAVPSSVTSESTCFSGFEGDESGISDASGIIPAATPLVVSSNLINIESNSNEDVNVSVLSQSCLSSRGSVRDIFLPSAVNSSTEFLDDSKENNQNYCNVNNLKLISLDHEWENSTGNKSTNSSFENSESNLNCIQMRLMDANTCGMSLFESFYSHLCGLYTRNDFPSEDLQKIAINPLNLQIASQATKNCNSPYKNSYLELETRLTQTLVADKKHTINTDSTAPPTICDIKSKTLPDTSIKIDHSPIKNNETKSKNENSLNTRATPLKPSISTANLTLSPELFSDEEADVHHQSLTLPRKSSEPIYVTANDRKLLKRAQESLGNVLPPPSVTIMQITIDEMLKKIKSNKHLFSTNDTTESCCKDADVNNVQKECSSSDNLANLESKVKSWLKTVKSQTSKTSLLVTCKKEEFTPELWPDVMQQRYHGLHHNRNKISEDFEHLCLKYAERYIGAETQSSCTVFGFGMDVLSPSKRRFKVKRVTKSPGKRLSHLARRKISFSKDSLQSGSSTSSCSFIGARTRQIMVDARKCEMLARRKSPKKKTPRKTPGKSPRKKSRTPGSSTKKRFAMRLRMYSTEENTMDSVASSSSTSRASVTKRALFQSPPKTDGRNGLLQLFLSSASNSDTSQSAKRRTPRRALFPSPKKCSPSRMSITSLYPPKRKMTPKRALFMSPSKSPSKHGDCDRKRKRVDMDDGQPSKLSRSMSIISRSSSTDSKSRSIRSHSITAPSSVQPQEIVEHRKKKLMWAVAEALRSQNIDLKHAQFKVFASVLARVIRHFLPNLFNNGPRPEGSTTESMLRIARQHVFAVTRGKTVSQIVREVENSKARASKPSGYVAMDKADRASDVSQAKNKENILQDRVNIISSDRLGSDSGHGSKNNRGENVERIRRVINFGDEEDVAKSGIR